MQIQKATQIWIINANWKQGLTIDWTEMILKLVLLRNVQKTSWQAYFNPGQGLLWILADVSGAQFCFQGICACRSDSFRSLNERYEYLPYRCRYTWHIQCQHHYQGWRSQTWLCLLVMKLPSRMCVAPEGTLTPAMWFISPLQPASRSF